MIGGRIEMIPCESYNSLIYNHSFSKNTLPVVVGIKVGVKESCSISICVLDWSSNDECNGAWCIQDHVRNHVGVLFPFTMVYFKNQWYDESK